MRTVQAKSQNDECVQAGPEASHAGPTRSPLSRTRIAAGKTAWFWPTIAAALVTKHHWLVIAAGVEPEHESANRRACRAWRFGALALRPERYRE
jgi:hypothetical protein